MIHEWYLLIFILFIFNYHINDIKRLIKKIIMIVLYFGNQLNKI